MNCLNCEYGKKIEDKEEMCTYFKCMKTSKKGKTICWHMTNCWDSKTGQRIDVNKYFAERFASNRKSPFWCPLKKDVETKIKVC